MRVALTGASGRLGSQLASALRELGHEVQLLGRATRPAFDLARAAELQAEWERALAGADILVHAGWDLTTRPLDRRARINVEGSRALVSAARGARVHRIVFLSSTLARDDAQSHYGRAKRDVERQLRPESDLSLRIGLVLGDATLSPGLQQLLSASPWTPWFGSGRELIYCIEAHAFRAAAAAAIVGPEVGMRYVMERTPLTPAQLLARLTGRRRVRVLRLSPAAFAPVLRLLGADTQKVDSVCDLRRLDLEPSAVVIP